jgi:cytochrome c oxidase subunit I
MSQARKEELLDTALDDAALHDALMRQWQRKPGLIGWLSSADHKEIGRRFIVTALVFLVLGGLAAVLMRLQLSLANNPLMGPDFYNQLFTMHGTTMMFLFGVPVMEAIAVYVLPLMLGTRALAFPRLNAFAYWVYLFGGAMLWIAFVSNTGADAGWFAYVPLSGPEFTPGKRTDFWAQMITFTEVSALCIAVQLIVTTFKHRAPGMTLDRIPLFVWSVLVTDFMILFAMPVVMIASSFLIMDRLIDTQFYNPAEGGDALLWQHLFWFFGHPEVYIIFVPALGMVSSIVAAFARRPVVGYLPMVLSLVATGFLSFGLWVHHMFAAGLPRLGSSFFTASSMMIAIPSGIQIFCWIATLWSGRPRFATPLLFVLGFVFTFVMGGLTGVMVASVPLDFQVHDTYFVVAHFHYTLIGGAVFPLLGALFYWYPKISGRRMSEALGKTSFWLIFVGFNVAFFPMHLLGLAGMPRRIYTYAADTGWQAMNQLVTAGALVLVVGLVLVLWNAWRSWRSGAPAGNDPWDAGTLEWATPSPPPPYNFARIPVATSREPLWHDRESLPVVGGMRADLRQVLVTSVADAVPELREASPQPSIWPLLAALATTALFVGSVFTPWAVVWGSIPVAIAMTGWFWPKGTKEDEE